MNTKKRTYILFGLIISAISVAISVGAEYFIDNLIKRALWPPNQAILYIILSLSIVVGVISAFYVVIRIGDLNNPKGFILLVVIFSAALISREGVYFALKEVL